jgi:hypothetical protein
MPVTSPALLASTEHEAIAEFIVGGLVVAAVWMFWATVVTGTVAIRRRRPR